MVAKEKMDILVEREKSASQIKRYLKEGMVLIMIALIIGTLASMSTEYFSTFFWCVRDGVVNCFEQLQWMATGN